MKPSPKRYYIGLAATLHDPALAIVDPSGTPVFAEAAERYLQCKRAYNCPPDEMIRIPRLVREYCEPEVELVAALSWSAGHLARLTWMSSVSPFFPGPPRRDPSDPGWPLPDSLPLGLALRNSISQASLNLASSKQIPNSVVVRHYDHHLTHAAAAAYTSPFEECVVAVVDGFGEASSTAFFHYCEGELTPLPEQTPAHAAADERVASLGFFYGRLCALCGFDPLQGEEWKVMGLAAYGQYDPTLYELLRPLIRVEGLTLRPGCSQAEEAWRVRELRSRMRPPGSSPRESADLAFTGQEVFEEVMTELLHALHARGLSANLALSGGCALNSSYNGRILERTPFERLYLPPAPADDGNALGAALLAHHEDHRAAPRPAFQTPYLGSSLSPRALRHLLDFGDLRRVTHAPADLPRRVAALLAEGKIVGWVQGRAEFGPRALGNRSVLADPRPREMKDRINARVKFREEYRPFAPAILDEHGPEYFEDYQPSPYMERTLRFRREVLERVPAVVHADRTGRVQSVRREWNPLFYDLIRAFHRLTGVPLVLNTSFNIMGKPIVHSVEDAVAMFFTTGLDALVLQDYLIEKEPAA